MADKTCFINASSNNVSEKTSSAQKSVSLENINNLLYLETLKRYKEHKINFRHQAEEKSKQYEEAQAEYRYYYELYVQLFKNATTKALQESVNDMMKPCFKQLDPLDSNINAIKKRVINENTIANFNPESVKKCQQEIQKLNNYDKISEIQDEIIKEKNAVKAIQAINESIEQKLEVVTTQSIEFYTSQIQNKFMENELSNLSEIKEN